MVAPDLGARVSCDGFIGTVKYVGEVPPASGIWWGVDWDESSRGKHDGSHGGIRYFQASHQTSGSFVRPSKCTLGISLLEAVRQKYVSMDEMLKEDQPGEADQQVIGKVENKEILFVGVSSILKEQRSLNTLRHINLRKCEVSYAGKLDGENGQSIFPSVTELDLSHNLFSDWNEIFNIIEHMPALEVLYLQGNVFSRGIPTLQLVLDNIKVKKDSDVTQQEISEKSIEEMTFVSHHRIKELCLYNLSLDWENLLCLSVLIASNVETLVASLNLITSIDLSMHSRLCEQLSWKPLSRVTNLNLEGNLVGSWCEVLKIDAVMPFLKKLTLNSCNISEIFFDLGYAVTNTSLPENGKTKIFSHLTIISLSRNNISNWESINELNRLQSLTYLNMKQNPIDGSHTEFTNWGHKVVARISGLTHLNGIEIDRFDRRGAEIDYLKSCIMELGAAEANEVFLKKHPRYNELVKKYGLIEVASPEVKLPELKAGLLKINIALISPMTTDEDKDNMREKIVAVSNKRLLKAMTVGKLKMTIKNIFKKDLEEHFKNSKDFSLSYVSADFTNKNAHTNSRLASPSDLLYQNTLEPGSVIEIPMDNLFKELDYYGITEQDTIYVRCV